MRFDWITKLLLLAIVVFLGVLVFRPVVQPQPVFAQDSTAYPFSIQQGHGDAAQIRRNTNLGQSCGGYAHRRCLGISHARAEHSVSGIWAERYAPSLSSHVPGQNGVQRSYALATRNLVSSSRLKIMKGELTKLHRTILKPALDWYSAWRYWHAVADCLLPAWAIANSKSVTVASNVPWTDTGIDVTAGDKLHITATGTVDFSDKTGVGPAGAERGWKDTILALSVSSAGRGALVGRVGNDPAALPFLIGADGTVTVPVAGRLFLGINQSEISKPTSGKFQVQIQRTPAATQVASGAAASSAKYDFQPLFATLAEGTAQPRKRQAGGRQSRRSGELCSGGQPGSGQTAHSKPRAGSSQTRPIRRPS